MLPISLVASTVSGILDGITRFKTLKTPLLKSKIIYSCIIMVLAFAQWYTAYENVYTWVTLVLSLLSLGCAVKLGLMGKKLLDVILPGKYVPRKKKSTTGTPAPKVVKDQAEAWYSNILFCILVSELSETGIFLRNSLQIM